MKPMISTTDSKYLRRLASEIRNSFEHGVYYGQLRISAVKYSRGVLMVRSGFESTWGPVSFVEDFHDGYGRQIVASRQ